jgi:hypothetical protein
MSVSLDHEHPRKTHFQELKHVKSYVEVGKSGIEDLEIDIVDIFGDETRNFGRRVANNVKQCYNVGSSRQVLKDLNLSFDLFFLYGLQNLYDALLLRYNVNAFKHL